VTAPVVGDTDVLDAVYVIERRPARDVVGEWLGPELDRMGTTPAVARHVGRAPVPPRPVSPRFALE
jgi:hypothetical protein